MANTISFITYCNPKVTVLKIAILNRIKQYIDRSITSQVQRQMHISTQQPQQMNSDKLEYLKKRLNKYPQQSPTFIYTIASKESGSTFFSNDRVLFINLKLKTINYGNIGKYQPFVGGTVVQAKGSINIASNTFKYIRVKQKQPSIKFWEDRSVDQSSKKLQEWKFDFYNIDTLLQLINVLNYLYNSSKSTAKPQKSEKDSFIRKNPQLNNNLMPNSVNPQPIHTPSSQVAVSQAQSPIHKLEGLSGDQGNKFKYSQAQKDRIGKEQADQGKFKSVQEEKRMQASGYSQASGNGNKLLAEDSQKIMTPSSADKIPKEQEIVQQHQQQQPSKKKQVPRLNMQKLLNTRSFDHPNPNLHLDVEHQNEKSFPKMSKGEQNNAKSFNSSQQNESDDEDDEGQSYDNINTENILGEIEQQQNRPNTGHNYQGSKAKQRIKNPIQVDISSIEYYGSVQQPGDKNQGDQTQYYKNFVKKEERDNQQNMKGNNVNLGSEEGDLYNSLDSFGLNYTAKNNSENLGVKHRGTKMKANQGNKRPSEAFWKQNKVNGKNIEQNRILDQNANIQQLNNSKQLVSKPLRPRKNNHIDWNRIFRQSGYSIQVYAQFTQTCKQLFLNSVLELSFASLNSNASVISHSQDGIRFTIVKPVPDFNNQSQSPRPTLYLKQNKTMLDIGTLVQLYIQVNNEITYRKAIWQSNRYVMETLLLELQSKQIKGEGSQAILNKLALGIGCALQLMGFYVYCEAQFFDKHYRQKQNWEVIPQIRNILSQVQQLIHLQLPTQNFKIHESNPTFYTIQFLKPIQLPLICPQFLLQSYINPLTMQKSIPASSVPYIFNSLSSKSLQDGIYSIIENELAYEINHGYQKLKIGQPVGRRDVFAIAGAQDWYNIMRYYNVTNSQIGYLFGCVDIPYYRSIIVSQLCSQIFCNLLLYTFHMQLELVCSSQFKKNSNLPLSSIQQLYNSICYVWLNNLLSYNYPSSQILWNYIKQILNDVYAIKCDNRVQDTIPGYILDFVTNKLAIKMRYWKQGYKSNQHSESRSRSRSKSQGKTTQIRTNFQVPVSLTYCYTQADILAFLKPDSSHQTFEIESRLEQYRASRFTFMLSVLEYKIFQDLVSKRLCKKQTANLITGLVSEYNPISKQQEHLDLQALIIQLTIKASLPSYLEYLGQYIKLYLSQFVSYLNWKQYSHLHIYSSQWLPILSDHSTCRLVPHSSPQLQVYMQIIRYLLQNNDQQLPLFSSNIPVFLQDSLHLLNTICEENAFWNGEFNPYMARIFILFTNYFIRQGDYQQAIKYYKSGMVIYVKIYANEELMADRHCFLSQMLTISGKFADGNRQIETAINKYENVLKRQTGSKQGRINIKGSQVVDKIDQDTMKLDEHKTYQLKILVLKYIRSMIKRSKNLLRTLKSAPDQTPPRSTTLTYSSQQTGHIIDPLYSILDHIRHPKHIRAVYSISSPNASSHQCYPFLQFNLIQIQEIITEIVEIMEIIMRCFVVGSRLPQLSVFVGQYMLNRSLLQYVGLNLSAFKSWIKLLMWYELGVCGATREKSDNQLFCSLLQKIQQRIQLPTQIQAFTYLYHKYIKQRKNDQNFTNQKPIQTYDLRTRERSRSRSPTSIKNERPPITILLKRLNQSLKNIRKLSKQIGSHKLISKHISLNQNTKNEAQQFIVLIEAISGVLGGFDLLIGLTSFTLPYYEDAVKLEHIGEGRSSSSVDDSGSQNGQIHWI